jgi:2,3-bisphosphoglycerate-independent phosphoglycerate mutase
MGNSEVGHLNIGAGRVVEQWLQRIGRELEQGSLAEHAPYQSFLSNTRGATLHLFGLFSDGGVHSHCSHLYALLGQLDQDFDGEIVVHMITDGRDTSPHQALEQIEELESIVSSMKRCRIASVCGRFYAMDRDKRWERVQKAYNAFVNGEAPSIESVKEYISQSYADDITDEFIEPAIVGTGAPFSTGDAAIFWNFRADRMREIVSATCLEDFTGFERKTAPLNKERVLCFTEYDETYALPVLFEQISITNHLGDTIAAAGLKQLRTAETEKYPHVTYFLNGGIEECVDGEERKLVASPRDVKTYDLKPEMSAFGVRDIVLEGIRSEQYGLIVVNFANCDMVGHTGVFDAAVKAVETVDKCLGDILAALNEHGGQAIIIADHGNAEQMINYEDGSVFTAHTTFPVPIIYVGENRGRKFNPDGALCDVAPTVLQIMGIAQPEEMSGKPLLS